MSQPAVTGTEKHFNYLDSARGIAALMVFLSHFIARTYQEKMNVHWFFFLFNGNDAVAFFFVLSGFVLSYKYIAHGKPLDIRKFYVSRFFRLFPAYFLIILLSVLFVFRHDLNGSMLASIFVWNDHEFWQEALLFRFHNKYYYPGWTLTIEMLGSFLMPFYIVLAQRNQKLIPYLIVVTLIIGNNIFFSYLFLFGVVAACNYDGITSLSFRETRWYRYRVPILLASVALFSLRQLDSVSPFGPSYKDLASYLCIDFFTYSGLASFVFLVAILHSKKVQRVLENRVLVFLGKISYSVYLVHVLVINVLYLFVEKYLSGGHPILAFAGISILCIGMVVAVASLMHYFVEIPFIKLGKRVAGKLRPSLVIQKTV